MFAALPVLWGRHFCLPPPFRRRFGCGYAAMWDRRFRLSGRTEATRGEPQEQSALVLDNESKERALVGRGDFHGRAGWQISREFSVSDHGIDMEIEFKDDAGEATGKRLYLAAQAGGFLFAEVAGRWGGGVHDQGRAPWPLLDGARVSGAAGDSDAGGGGSLDGSAGVIEAR